MFLILFQSLYNFTLKVFLSYNPILLVVCILGFECFHAVMNYTPWFYIGNHIFQASFFCDCLIKISIEHPT
jgi:hypothetical protein